MNCLINWKKIVCSLFISLLIFIGMFLLAGCANGVSSASTSIDSSQPPQNISIVFSQRENSSACPNPSLLEPYLMAAVKSSSTLTYVRADGEPRQVNYEDADKLKASTKANEKNADRENKAKVDDFLDFITGEKSRACNPEVDLLAAITTAATTLHTTNGNDNVIIVIDSGISTKGRLSLCNGSFLNSDVTDFQNINNLPKMQHIKRIEWMGFNCIDDMQSPVPTDYPLDSILKTNINGFFRACGVNEDINWIANSNGTLDMDKDNLPSVTPVDFDISDMFDSNWTSVKLDNYKLTFKPDSDEFVDENSASTVLSGLAKQLKANPNMRISIFGYIAWNGPEKGDLSLRRANRLKSALQQMGVTNDINAVGKGAGPYPYLDQYGQVNAQNRYIEVIRDN